MGDVPVQDAGEEGGVRAALETVPPAEIDREAHRQRSASEGDAVSDRAAFPLGPDQLGDAAALLRQVLALVKAGELEAATPTARALLRRVEGAAIAAELAAGVSSQRP